MPLGGVEPIDDVEPATVDKTEVYILDLENEIAQLSAANKLLKKRLKSNSQQDISCCEAYKVLAKNFHKLINDIIPF